MRLGVRGWLCRLAWCRSFGVQLAVRLNEGHNRGMTATNLRHGGHTLSATITNGEVVIFDLPATAEGRPGTVTADQSAAWTEQDWRNLANQRTQALRRRQRAAGMHRRMNPAYEAAVAAERARDRDERTRYTWTRVSATEVDRHVGGTLIETYYRERVPALGLTWARQPHRLLGHGAGVTDREKLWLAAWHGGASYRAIAAQHHVGERTVRRVLAPHVAGQRRSGPRKKPAPTAEEVAEVYASIGSIRGVEAHYAGSSTPISETTVRARLAELGIVEHPDKRPRKGEGST